MANILSIDWDYFTGDCYTIGSVCPGCSWLTKCTSRVLGGQDGIYYPERNIEAERSLSDPLKDRKLIKYDIKGAAIIVAECHSDIYGLIKRRDTVINFDTHEDVARCFDETDPDLNYYKYNLSCGTWAGRAAYYKDITYVWVAPYRINKDDRSKSTYSEETLKKNNFKVDVVFICLSAPWTPRALDPLFFLFVDDCSRRTGNRPSFIGPWRRRWAKIYARHDRHKEALESLV